MPSAVNASPTMRLVIIERLITDNEASASFTGWCHDSCSLVLLTLIPNKKPKASFDTLGSGRYDLWPRSRDC